MSMTDWAENEINLAKKKMAKEGGDHSWDGYVSSCYDSALKAYKSLEEDGHSGMSFSVTRSILTNLMNEIPLTPIEEDEDCWNECGLIDGKRTFQCSRRPSLFKDVLESDGSISYHDNDLIVVDDVYEDHLSAVSSHFGDVIVKQMFGELVKFPYMPTKERYRVRRIETSLVYDGAEVAFVHFIKKPNGEKLFMNCFFDWNGKNYGNAPMQELSPEERASFLKKLDFSNSKC